jgi:hypothetical protein
MHHAVESFAREQCIEGRPVDDVQALDVSGPMDVFSATNQHVATSQARYDLCVIGIDACPVRSEGGLVMMPSCTLATAPALDTKRTPKAATG